MGYEPAGRISPVAPGPSLLTSARPLPGSINWSTGIAWTPVCQPSYVYEWCPPSVTRTPDQNRATVHTMPFVIYTPQSCDLPVDQADLESIVADLTETHTAAGLAAALWFGAGHPPADKTIPTLRRSAFDVAPAVPLGLDDGVAQLLVHYEQATGGLGGALIHMPSALAVYALGGGAGGARICWPEGSIYRGPLGSVIVPGPGYPNGFSPHGPDGNGPLLSAPGVVPENYAGNELAQSWIYVTGPVEYAVSPVRTIPEEDRDRVQPRTNIYELWGERDAIVRFDPCTCFGTLVVNPAPMPEVS